MNGDGEISSYLVNVDLRRANGATSTNTTRDIKEGSLYTTTLKNLSDDYADRIKITIGDLLGDDLSEQYFNKETRTITIPKVTGNINIICT
jgi:predicted membrane protein